MLDNSSGFINTRGWRKKIVDRSLPTIRLMINEDKSDGSRLPVARADHDSPLCPAVFSTVRKASISGMWISPAAALSASSSAAKIS